MDYHAVWWKYRNDPVEFWEILSRFVSKSDVQEVLVRYEQGIIISNDAEVELLEFLAELITFVSKKPIWIIRLWWWLSEGKMSPEEIVIGVY